MQHWVATWEWQTVAINFHFTHSLEFIPNNRPLPRRTGAPGAAAGRRRRRRAVPSEIFSSPSEKNEIGRKSSTRLQCPSRRRPPSNRNEIKGHSMWKLLSFCLLVRRSQMQNGDLFIYSPFFSFIFPSIFSCLSVLRSRRDGTRTEARRFINRQTDRRRRSRRRRRRRRRRFRWLWRQPQR